jgi:hypothetical protein
VQLFGGRCVRRSARAVYAGRHLSTSVRGVSWFLWAQCAGGI